MDKIMNGRRYFLYSSLTSDLKAIYYKQIYKFVLRLNFEYPGFNVWYSHLFCDSCDLKSNREIVICEESNKLAGIAILKNSYEEKKICTFRVAKEYQCQGIGHQLMELCFQQLKTEKPMITLHKNKLEQFEKLLDYYDFELEQMQKHYYNLFNTELVYNGALPRKKLFVDQFEIIDMKKIYKSFILMGKKDINEYIDICIKYWYEREQIRRLQI